MSIGDYVPNNAERFLDELAEYCRIPSVAAEGRGIEEAAGWVADRLARLGADVEMLSVPEGPPVVYAELGPQTAANTLLIYNHYDVQPADPFEAWTSDPFEPTIRDERLYCRGVADNKANFLSRVHAIEAWQERFGALPLRIKWLVEGEEEVGSPSLTSFCEKHGARWSDVDGCLWESGRKNELERHELYSGLKGIAAFELRLRGANADKHSSWATLLPNPAWRLVWLLSTLKGPDETIAISGLMDHVVAPSDAERELVENLPFDDRALQEAHGVSAFVAGVSGSAAMLRHLYQPTCTICGIGSGYAGPGMKTVLPHEAFVKLDFRLVADLTPDLVRELLLTHLAAHGFDDVEVIDLEGEHPAPGRIDSRVVQTAVEAARRVSDAEPVLLPHMAATGPMYPVATQYGIPAVGFGTGNCASNVHAPDENIRVSDYYEGIALAAEFFRLFGG